MLLLIAITFTELLCILCNFTSLSTEWPFRFAPLTGRLASIRIQYANIKEEQTEVSVSIADILSHL